jgi:molybdopterin-biosynthesis enzyme MoeA-like protein
MPGFPEMAWPMIEWVINHYYLEFSKEKTTDDQSLWIDDRSESTLIDLMRSIEKQFTDVRIYSLPKLSPNKTLEFGIKGDKQQVKNAMHFLKKFLSDEKISWRENK